MDLAVTAKFQKSIGTAATKRLMARYSTVEQLMSAVRDQGIESDQRDIVKLAKAFELTQALLTLDMKQGDAMASPAAVRMFLRMHLANRPAEAFYVIYLDNQNRFLESIELFRGTLSQTAVYPREVLRYAMNFNAAAVILAHNHPSNSSQPSHADRLLTDALKTVLGHLDVRVLDHFIVTSQEMYSFGENGLL